MRFSGRHQHKKILFIGWDNEQNLKWDRNTQIIMVSKSGFCISIIYYQASGMATPLPSPNWMVICHDQLWYMSWLIMINLQNLSWKITKNHQKSQRSPKVMKIIILKWNLFDDLIFYFSSSYSRSPKIMKLDYQRSWKMFHFNVVIFGH